MAADAGLVQQRKIETSAEQHKSNTQQARVLTFSEVQQIMMINPADNTVVPQQVAVSQDCQDESREITIFRRKIALCGRKRVVKEPQSYPLAGVLVILTDCTCGCGGGVSTDVNRGERVD